MLIRHFHNLLGFFIAIIACFAVVGALHAAPISRSITISGSAGTDATFSDWTTVNNSTTATVAADWGTPTDVTNNAGQFSSDGLNEDPACPTPITSALDLDCGGGGGAGRDLRKFSFTYDFNNLYMYVERFASATSVNDWWFYLDVDSNGLMETGEPVLRVKWSGSVGSTVRELWLYQQVRVGGDPVTCPATGPYSFTELDNVGTPGSWCPVVGEGDGYTMPGTITSSITSYPTIYGGAEAGSGEDALGGSLAGVSMETFISWTDMGKSGPGSIGFHISSSNGSNLPSNIIDNMTGTGGVGGGSISFSELAITKTASSANVVGGDQFTYTFTITNNGDADATNIEVTDIFPVNVTYSSDDVVGPQTTNLVGSTLIWNIPTLANGASTSLTVTMDTTIVAVDTPVSNTVDITDQDNSEINNPDDNTDTADITLIPAPDLIIDKSHTGSFSDGATGAYNLLITNQGDGDETGTITVTDTLPAGLAYVSGSGTGWACGAIGQVVSCTNADTLASGASLNNLQILVSVGPTAVPSVINTASVIGTTQENVTGNNSDTDPTNVTSGTSQMCYAVDGQNNTLSLIDTSDFAAASNETNVGTTGVTGIDAVAYDCGNGILYAANNGQIGSLNQATGAFTALASPAGSSANGALGTVNFNDINGLAYEPATSALYASVNSVGTDVLIQINVATGTFVPNAFGVGIDYVAIGSIASITDISVNHSDGLLYGIDGGADNLLTINKTTGATSNVGALGITNITGLGADGAGGFWGSTSNGAITENVYEVNSGTGVAANPRAIDGGAGTSFDYDAYDCIANCATQQVDLVVSKTVDDSTPLLSTNVVYTIQVTNNGPATATTVQILDNLPANVTYVSDAPSQGSYNTTTGIWFVGSIASGASASLTITASADTIGVKTNTASVSYVTQTDTDNTNDSDSVDITPVSSDLSTSTKVGVDLNGGDTEAGDIIEYTITLKESAGAASTGVSVTDPLPANTGNLTIISTPVGSIDSSTATLVDISNITVGASGTETIVFQVTIQAGTANNTSITNTATITNPSGPGATPAATPLIVAGASEVKTLYLQGSTALTRIQHATNTSTVIAKNTSNTWTLGSTIFNDMVLDSTQSLAIPIWITAVQAKANGATVTLNCSSCTNNPIASASVNINNGGPTRYTFSLNFGADVTVNTGSNYSLTITNNSTSKNLTVDTFIAGEYSKIDKVTKDVIKVTNVSFYDDAYPGGNVITSLLPGEPVYIRADVTDPFGAFDINAAFIELLDSNSNQVVAAGTSMGVEVASTASTKTYEYLYNVLVTDPTGIWSALVTADEGTEGTVSHTNTGTFEVRESVSLTLLKMVQTFSDPVNILSNPKAIPGAFMDYTIIVTNSGAGYVDTDSSIITDPIPTGTELFVGNISDGSDPATPGNGPVLFTDGAGAASSTLTYTFTALANLADDVHFSSTTAPADTNDPAWDYVPVSAGGFDSNVKFIRVTPKGSHAEDIGTSTTYSVKFRVRLQ